MAQDSDEKGTEWYDSPVTKSDLYYVSYAIMAVMFVVYSRFVYDHSPGEFIFVMGIATFCVSMSLAAGYDGINRAFWTKVINYV